MLNDVFGADREVGEGSSSHALLGIGEGSNPRGMKRRASDAGSTDTFTRTEGSQASSNTRRRKARRFNSNSALSDGAARGYKNRFPFFEYMGKQATYRKMDKKLEFAEPCPFFTQYAKLNSFPDHDVNSEETVFVKANSVVELNHLEYFSRPVKELPPWNVDLITFVAQHVSELLHLPSKLDFPSVASLETVKYIGDKFPGIEYARKGFKDRCSAHPTALPDAERAFLDLMAGKRVEPHLNRMGGRGKLTTKTKIEADQGKPAKGRLILMTSQRDLLLNGVTENQLTNAYKASYYPVSIGQSWFHGESEKFMERFDKFDRFLCCDAKKYDAHLQGWLVRIAINIVRGQYNDGLNPQYDAYWEFVYEGLVESTIFFDDGHIFKKHVGTTSGHSHNTLLQSICTLLVAYGATLANIDPYDWEEAVEDMWVEAMGDDQITGVKGLCAEISNADVVKNAWIIYNIDWSGDKSIFTDLLVDLNAGAFQGVQYLGKMWRVLGPQEPEGTSGRLVPYRPCAETGQRLHFPEYGSLEVSGAWERALGHYLDGAGNPRTRDWLEGYMDWLYPQISTEDVVWGAEWERKWGEESREEDSFIPTKRIDYKAWLYLVLEPKVVKRRKRENRKRKIKL